MIALALALLMASGPMCIQPEPFPAPSCTVFFGVTVCHFQGQRVPRFTPSCEPDILPTCTPTLREV